MSVAQGDKSLQADNQTKQPHDCTAWGRVWITGGLLKILPLFQIPFRPKTAGLHTVGGPNLNNRPSGDSRVDKRQSKDRTLWGSRCIVADRRGRESYLGT